MSPSSYGCATENDDGLALPLFCIESDSRLYRMMECLLLICL